MVKVIITLVYSSAGSFCSTGKEPWGKREKVSPQNLLPSARGTHREGLRLQAEQGAKDFHWQQDHRDIVFLLLLPLLGQSPV